MCGGGHQMLRWPLETIVIKTSIADYSILEANTASPTLRQELGVLESVGEKPL